MRQSYDDAMTRFGVDYHVSRSTGICNATGRVLAPGEVCIATLCDRPDDEAFDRLDFSTEAWESGTRPERLFSYWKSVVPEPNAKRRLIVDDEVLLNLFERLADDERPQRVAFRFVVTLMLMRRKVLRYTGRETIAGQEHWLVTRRGSPDATPEKVVNPTLTDDDIRGLTDQLTEVLQAEF